MEKNQCQNKPNGKNPWRYLFLAGAVLSGGYLLLRRFLLSFGMILSTFRRTPGESASIGIIGGADGPTAIFVTTQPGFDWETLIVGGIALVCIIAFLRLGKCKGK